MAATFDPTGTDAAFRAFLGARRPEALSPAAGLAAMLDFYAEARAADVDLDADGDMALFQWGTSRWRTGTPEFTLDITRQLILPGAEDDDAAIWQLGLVWAFAPAGWTESTGRGNRWCGRPEGQAEFRDFVLDHPATLAAESHAPQEVWLRWDCAG